MDLGGFAASLYMRGIKHVTLIPTTFLGMVDATVGGKTAVNYSNTKNLLGTIRNSNNIIIFPSFLSTQTER
jgi:3-dehydroquinate synthase